MSLQNFFRLLAIGAFLSIAGCGGGGSGSSSGGSSSGGGGGGGTTTTYSIVATAGSGGSISPVGTTTINSGASQLYSITPATGYSIQSVLVDGASVGAVPSYTFSNITANHTISASFTPSPYTVTLTASKNIALNNNSDSVNLTAIVSPAVPDGSVVTFSAPAGTTISNVTPTVGSVATAVARSTTQGDVSITASFLLTGNGSTIVKFIPQPTSAVVTIAINKPVTKLDSLNLKVTNTTGAAFSDTSATLNEALANGAILIAGIAISDPSTIVSVGLASANGFDVLANSPIIQLNYAVSAGIPTFTVSSVPSASTFPSVPIILNPSDFVVNATYN